MKKLMVLAALGVGYVLGARAGRERFDQLVGQFDKVRKNPQVQEQAQHLTEMAKEQAPVIKDKVSDVAAAAVNKVHPTGSDENDPEWQGSLQE